MTHQTEVLITGGCGFVGHHLALALKRLGMSVTVFDDFRFDLKLPAYRNFIEMRFRKLAAAKIPIVHGDAMDIPAVTAVLERVKPAKVIHLAAIVSAAVCDHEPDRGYQVNLHATQKLLELLRRQTGLRQFVFLSSSMVYGHFRTTTVTEQSPTDPIGIYGAGKLAGEHMVKAYHNIFGLPFTIVRPSALYGPTCINRRVSQLFIEAALGGRTLVLEGGGEDRLDFTFIDDLVQGLVLVVTRPNALNQTFNLTYGESRKIKDLVALIRKRYPDVQVKTKPWKKTTPHRGTLEISRARRLLGFAPKYPLEEGYPLYMDWYDAIDFKTMLGEDIGMTHARFFDRMIAPRS